MELKRVAKIRGDLYELSCQSEMLKQGDDTVFRIDLTNNGRAYCLPDNVSPVLVGIRNDGHKVIQTDDEGIIVDGNRIKVPLKPEFLSVTGRLTLELNLIDTLTGDRVSYFPFSAVVDESMLMKDVPDAPESYPLFKIGDDGKDGIDGIDGQDGASAYDIAVENGFTGTEQEWLDSLHGRDGIDGQQGLPGRDGLDGADGLPGKDGNDGLPGKDGADGQDGSSAYEIAVENGFSGTEQEWLESLHGEDGVDGAQGLPGRDGVDGNDGLPGKDGADGKDGAPGTPGADGSNGVDGQDGASAYDIAVEHGFSGTEQEWLDSLHGEDGADGQDGAQGLPGVDGQNGQDGADGMPGVVIQETEPDGEPGHRPVWLKPGENDIGNFAEIESVIAYINSVVGDIGEMFDAINGEVI